MSLEFAISEEKKELSSAFVEEVEEILEMAEDALSHDNLSEATRRILSTAEPVEEIDRIFHEAEGYQDIKDFWRSGIEAAQEDKVEEAIEDIRRFLDYLH